METAHKNFEFSIFKISAEFWIFSILFCVVLLFFSIYFRNENPLITRGSLPIISMIFYIIYLMSYFIYHFDMKFEFWYKY